MAPDPVGTLQVTVWMGLRCTTALSWSVFPGSTAAGLGVTTTPMKGPPASASGITVSRRGFFSQVPKSRPRTPSLGSEVQRSVAVVPDSGERVDRAGQQILDGQGGGVPGFDRGDVRHADGLGARSRASRSRIRRHDATA